MVHLKQLYGKQLEASDGAIGHVKDFYFDDQNWVVRYVVVDTGSWLLGQQVLITPHAFGNLHKEGESLCVNLTRKQIENSPTIDAHKPVSRQFEMEYYQYYGWPNYWQGTGLWGMSGFPIMELQARPFPDAPDMLNSPKPTHADLHLRCTKGVDGYHITAGDETVGHVCDFIMNAKSWAISQLVVKTGNLFSGKDVQIPTKKVSRISYEESTVSVNMTREAVEQSPTPHPVSENA